METERTMVAARGSGREEGSYRRKVVVNVLNNTDAKFYAL